MPSTGPQNQRRNHVQTRTVGRWFSAATACFAGAASAQTVKIAYIDPLSGAFANVGEAGLKQFQFVADDINARGTLPGPA